MDPAVVSLGVFALGAFLAFTWIHKEEKRSEKANLDQGEEAIKCGDSDLALSCANEEIKRDPKSPRGHALRGRALHQKRRYRQAIEDYCQAIRLQPGKGALFLLRGDSHAALQDFDRAISDYSDAIRLNPADSRAIDQRKTVYYLVKLRLKRRKQSAA